MTGKPQTGRNANAVMPFTAHSHGMMLGMPFKQQISGWTSKHSDGITDLAYGLVGGIAVTLFIVAGLNFADWAPAIGFHPRYTQ